MRVRTKLLALFALTSIGAMGLFNLAEAQPTPKKPGQPGGDIAPALQTDQNLSPDEMVKKGDEHVASIEKSATTIRKMLEDARSRKDVPKTVCLNDKSNQVNVTFRVAKDRKKSLDQGFKRSDREQMGHDFTMISVLRAQSDKVMTQANACIGTEVDVTAPSTMTPTVEPGIPTESDVTPEGVLLPPLVPPPSCNSCSL